MTKSLKASLRKGIVSIVMMTTIFSLSGVAALVPTAANAATFVTGDLVRNPNQSGMAQFDVYVVKVVGTKMFKRLILSPAIFNSYGGLFKWSNVKTVSSEEMNSFKTSGMVRVETGAPVFAVAPVDGSDVGSKSWLNVSADTFVAAGGDWDAIYTINSIDGAGYSAATDLTTQAQVVTYLTTGALPGVSPVSGALTVALAANTPASTTIISYGSTASKQAQASIPFITVNFTAGSGDVKVTNLKFNRTGIAADSSLAYTYLYDGATKLAEGGSISAKVLTFNDASGLFTVSAGTTKSITLVGDLNSTAASGQTLGFSLAAATDITSNAASATGSFPVSGNLMSIAAATDLGYALAGGSYATPATETTVSAQNDYTVWTFNLQAVGQNLQLEKLVFTEVGSITTTDLQNFKLYNGGTLLGSVANMNANRQVVIDMSASPFGILSGNTKTLALHADIVSGATRTFAFTLQNSTDIKIKDASYGVYVPTNLSTLSGTWTLIQPTNHYLISSGSISVTKRTDSPTGNVPKDATNVLLAKYDFKATGEDIKVSNLRVSADTTGAAGLDNGMVFLNGIQVGSTTDLVEYTGSETATQFTFGNSFVIPAGTTALVEVKADIKTTAAASLTAGDTVTAYLRFDAAYNNGQGVSSLTILDVPDTANKAGNALTVQAGSLTFTKNASYGAQSTTAPATQFKVGSFQMLAGSSEGVNVDSITVDIEDATAYAKVSNLTLKVGSDQIGTTKVTPSTANTFSVNVALAASQAKTVDIYADILSTAGAGAIDADGYDVSGTGTTTVTSTAANVTVVVPLQVITVATGALSVSYDSGNVLDTIAVGLQTGVKMAKYKFASTYESFTVNEVKVYASSKVDRTTPRYAKTNLPDFLNVWLSYTNSSGVTVTTAKRSNFVNGMMSFTGLDLKVPANGSASVIVYADLNDVAAAGFALTGDRPQISLAYYKANSGSMSLYERRTGILVYGEDGATVTPMTWVADSDSFDEADGTGAYALQFVNAGQDADDGAELDIPLSDLNLTVADFVTAGDLITYSAYSTVTNSVPMVTLFMDCNLDGSLDGEILYSPTETITASTWTAMSYATNTKTADWWANAATICGTGSSGSAVALSTLTQTARIMGASFSIYSASNAVGTYKVDNLVLVAGTTPITYNINGVEDDMGSLGTNYVLYKTKPVVTRVGVANETSLTNGTQDIYRFNIAADNGGDVAVKDIAFSITGSAALTNIDTLKLYKGSIDYTDHVVISTLVNGTGTSVEGTGTTITTDDNANEIFVSFTDEEVISAGTSQNFTLKARVVGAAASTSISTYMQSDAYPSLLAVTTDVVRGAAYATAIATTNNVNHFIWSDMSTGSTHSLTSSDWINGFLVDTLGNGLTYTVSQ